MNGRFPTSMHLDERGIIRGMIVQAVVLFVLLGLSIYDGGQILFSQVKAHTAAGAAADAAVDVLATTGNELQARAAADEAARAKLSDARIVAYEVTPEGAVVVTVEVVADTLVVSRVGFMEDLGVQHGTESAARQS
jgi:hypothetical protein